MFKRKAQLMAIVAATFLIAAGAAAQDHYQVYGQVHVSTDLQNNGDESSLFVSSNTTRFGIRGKFKTDVEQFTVVYQYENAADFSGERSGLSARNSYAGLTGDWGRLIWGRHDTPVYTLGRAADLFDGRIGDLRNVTAGFGAGWDMRPNSMIMYSTPKLSEAFTLNAQYIAEEGRDDAMFFSASGVYEQGNLLIGLGFESHGKGWEPAYASEDEDVDPQDSTGLRAVVRYRADGLTIAGLFQSISNVGGFEDVSATTMGAGIAYKLESGLEPKVQVYMMDPNTDVDDNGAMMVAVGVDYHLTAKARLYLAYAMMANEDNAGFSPFGGGHGKSYGYGAEELGESPYGISAGLVFNW